MRKIRQVLFWILKIKNFEVSELWQFDSKDTYLFISLKYETFELLNINKLSKWNKFIFKILKAIFKLKIRLNLKHKNKK